MWVMDEKSKVFTFGIQECSNGNHLEMVRGCLIHVEWKLPRVMMTWLEFNSLWIEMIEMLRILNCVYVNKFWCVKSIWKSPLLAKFLLIVICLNVVGELSQSRGDLGKRPMGA